MADTDSVGLEIERKEARTVESSRGHANTHTLTSQNNFLAQVSLKFPTMIRTSFSCDKTEIVLTITTEDEVAECKGRKDEEEEEGHSSNTYSSHLINNSFNIGAEVAGNNDGRKRHRTYLQF